MTRHPKFKVGMMIFVHRKDDAWDKLKILREESGLWQLQEPLTLVTIWLDPKEIDYRIARSEK